MAVNRVAVSDIFERQAGASAVWITGRWPGFLAPLFLTGLLLLLLVCPRFAAGADLVMSNGQAEKGEQATFTLAVNQAPRTLHAFMLDITYDVNVLRFSGFAPGELARNGYSLFRVFNPSPGVIRVGAVEPQDPGVRKGDSGDLVHVTFNVIQAGESPLALTALANDVEGWTTQNGRFAALSVDPEPEDATAEENSAKEGAGTPAVDSAGTVAAALSRSGGAGGYDDAPAVDAVDDNGEPVDTAVAARPVAPVADDQGQSGFRQALAAGNRQSFVEQPSDQGASVQATGSGQALPANRQRVNPAGRAGTVSEEPGKGVFQDRLTGFGLKPAAGTAGRQPGEQPPRSALFGGDRLFDVAARMVEIVLLAAILAALLLILREMKSQRIKMKIFPGSVGRPETDAPGAPETRLTGTDRQSFSSRIIRFAG